MLIAVVVALVVVVILLVLNLTTGAKKVKRELSHLYGVEDPQFVRTIGTLLGPALVPGNRVEALLQWRPDLPGDARGDPRPRSGASTFETYIYWSGEVGKEFADALAERARAGVKVHVLSTGVGCRQDRWGGARRR